MNGPRDREQYNDADVIRAIEAWYYESPEWLDPPEEE